MNRFYSLFLVLSISMGLAFSQTADSVKIYLWSEAAPFAKGIAEQDKPSITIYFPLKEKATESAVLICPGGGYVNLAMQHEGLQVAKWYNEMGVTAAILRYRLSNWEHTKYMHPIQFMDVTRAMRLFRSNATAYKINPEKIGIMGFSAGGHLASMVSTIFDGGNPNAKDPVERVSSKPNFSILIYPVISYCTKYAHDSRDFLMNANADPKQIDSISTETRVTPLTPPTFLLSTNDDMVKCENSILYFLALRENNVPAELHIYERGGHGYGLYPKERNIKEYPERIADWPERLKNWLKNRGGLIRN